MNPTAQEQSNSKKTQPNGLKELPSGSRNQGKPGSKRNEFLKVAPSLFTPEKLPLFDSLDLYTALIRSSNHLEQGERLHNLSWRIMNKALLKEHELNKSKKRDGVKNLYRVINPANSGQFPHPPQSRQASSAHKRLENRSAPNLQPMQIMSAMQGPVAQNRPASDHLHHANHPHPLHHKPARVTSELQVKRSPLHTPEPKVSHHQYHQHDAHLHRQSQQATVHHPPHNQSAARFTLGADSRVSSPELPQRSVVGFEVTSPVAKKKEDRSQLGSARSNDGSSNKKLPQRTIQPPRSTSSLFSTRSDDRHPPQGVPTSTLSHDHIPKSLFGKKPTTHYKATHTSEPQDGVFFSSDDDESDWNSLSDDDELYDDEEDDKYYQKQWDKLMFSRNDQSRGTSRSRHTTPPPVEKQDPKRSLLSGLFLSELSTKTITPPAMTPVTAQHPTLEESSVVAVGDVTPSSYRKSGSVFSQEIPQDAVTAQPVPSKISAGFKRIGSFSSIISDSTLQRYAHQSNAPPTAQTILPTALSTHMFLPNNVHQQRAARSISSRPGSSRRRESMDIPSKNRNNSFLKTRMELSEEEEFVRSTSGR